LELILTLAKIQFQPGINREGTQYSASGSWYDCDKVRFRQGRPEQIGGWEKYSENAIIGVARHLRDWNTGSGTAYIFAGTHVKAYVENGDTYYDITPIRSTTAAGDVTFAAVNGDATITVTDTSHGASLGDYVTFSGAASLGGLITASVLNHEYAISRIIDGNSYEVEATDTFNGSTVTANASDTGNGGAAVVGAYQLTIGTNTYVVSTGYSVDTYGGSGWGGGGTLAGSGQLRLMSSDIFNDDIIFNIRSGGVYYWDESVGTGTRAVALPSMGGASDAPTLAFQIMISTLDRHVIAFGVNPITDTANIDPMLVRWSDQEDAVDWTPTAINTAGGQVLSGGTTIIGAVKTRQEILIFTDTAIHSMRYSGAPFVFSFAIVSQNITSVGPNAAVVAGDAVYFMDLKGFYAYSGSVVRIPCPVFNYIYTNIDKTQLFKVFATANTDNSEVVWFYPSGENGAEINSYVTYNYLENVWTIGTLARGAWIQAESRSYPIASTIETTDITANYLYNHEFGYDADGSEMAAYIESGSMPIADGEQYAFIRRILPDFKFRGTTGSANMTVTLKGTDFPLETPATLATATVNGSTTQNHVRARTRDVVVRIASSGTGYGWTMGDFRMDMRTDGKR
jgi:hypothetical protein